MAQIFAGIFANVAQVHLSIHILEDNLAKLSSFEGLELYRSANEYRGKAETIRSSYEQMTSFDDLRRVGMGKEALKAIMRWANEELHLKLSKKALIDNLEESDIPNEIKTWFMDIKSAVKL